MLIAKIEAIEVVAEGEGPPLPVGVGVDPARCFRQALCHRVYQGGELILARFAADDGGAGDGERLGHAVFPLLTVGSEDLFTYDFGG